MKILRSFAFACVFFLMMPQSFAAEPVKIYTSVFPPFINDDNENPGYAYEIIEEVFFTAQIPYEIQIVPWARAQAAVQSQPETLIFPLSRSITREDIYSWGINIYNVHSQFVTINGLKLTKETAHHHRVGVQYRSSWDNWLTENAYTNVQRMPKEGHGMLRMMEAGRLDAWYTEHNIARKILQKEGAPQATYSDPIQVIKTYLATNREKPFARMDELVKAYEEIVASGRFDEILQKYDIEHIRDLPN